MATGLKIRCQDGKSRIYGRCREETRGISLFWKPRGRENRKGFSFAPS